MKKIIFSLVFASLVLASCGTTKFENLDSTKQDEIVKKAETKREELIKNIDTSAYTWELTEAQLKEIETKIQEVNKQVISDLKQEEKWVDFSILEERWDNNVKEDVKEIKN